MIILGHVLVIDQYLKNCTWMKKLADNLIICDEILDSSETVSIDWTDKKVSSKANYWFLCNVFYILGNHVFIVDNSVSYYLLLLCKTLISDQLSML